MEEITLFKLVKHGGKAYQVLRTIPLHQFLRKDGTIIAEKYNAWKQWLEADHVFKTTTHFVFCETVVDLDFEEISAEEN